MHHPDPQDRPLLRKTLRARRRALSHAQQRAHALRLCDLLKHQRWFQTARHIAFYLPADGEIDPRPLLNLALALGKHCYLPVLCGKQLRFRRYCPRTVLVCNRFGIAEPAKGTPERAPWLLDLVLMPLVGFDARGNRLGMGGGFYDRTFAILPGRPRPKGRRLGLAHSCQELAALPVQSWDIPLHGIATERGLLQCTNR